MNCRLKFLKFEYCITHAPVAWDGGSNLMKTKSTLIYINHFYDYRRANGILRTLTSLVISSDFA